MGHGKGHVGKDMWERININYAIFVNTDVHKTNCTNAYTRYLSDRSYSQLISSPPSTGFFLELRFDDCGLWVAGLMPAKVAESTMHLHTNTREAQVQIQAWILFECLFE